MLIPNGKVENNFDCSIVIASTDNVFLNIFTCMHLLFYGFEQHKSCRRMCTEIFWEVNNKFSLYPYLQISVCEKPVNL